ncbi:alpha/beta fold hydrolase [Undibacterium sp. TJN19]|uniref:alpha/beta fold hydrolase n=1 Tax=Undibacterium sp. TJN19 TaxID=3413055 RepID=UPI003BF3C020
MKTNLLTTVDNIELKYGYVNSDPEKPWVVLVIPFGLELALAKPFFEFFQSHYNICTWENRSVLENSDRSCQVSEFSIDRHVSDMIAVMDALYIHDAILVGYCSGAGIALAAINLQPNRFTQLVLAHGEYTMLAEKKYVTQFASDMDVLLCLAASNDDRAKLVFDKIQGERFDVDLNRPAGLDQPFSDIRFLRRYAKNYLAYKSVDFEQLAAEVVHPTLLMAGGKDMQVNIESSQKIHGHIKNSTMFVDPDADHYGVLTRDSNTMIAIWNHVFENAYERNYGRQYS